MSGFATIVGYKSAELYLNLIAFIGQIWYFSRVESLASLLSVLDKEVDTVELFWKEGKS